MNSPLTSSLFLIPLACASMLSTALCDPLILENGGLKNTYRITFEEIVVEDQSVRGFIEILGDESDREAAHTRMSFYGSILPVEGKDDEESLELLTIPTIAFFPPGDSGQPSPAVSGVLYGRKTDSPRATIDFYIYDNENGKWQTLPWEFGMVQKGEPDAEDWLSAVKIGDVFLGMLEEAVENAIGSDGELKRGELIVEGATGLTVQTWRVASTGLRLKMGKADGESVSRVYTFEIGDPSLLKTDRGIGIGSTRDEVAAAYGEEIVTGDQSGLEEGSLVAGTIYGGVIFFFDESDQVTRIFVGAAAE